MEEVRAAVNRLGGWYWVCVSRSSYTSCFDGGTGAAAQCQGRAHTLVPGALPPSPLFAPAEPLFALKCAARIHAPPSPTLQAAVMHWAPLPFALIALPCTA